MIDLALYLSYILIGACTVVAVIMPLVQSFSDPASLTKSGIGVAALVVVFIVSYALSDGSAPGASETTSKVVGAGIISSYVFFFGALIGIAYTEISKLIK